MLYERLMFKFFNLMHTAKQQTAQVIALLIENGVLTLWVK